MVIFSALDKNEYNHITATYFLLAERKLRSHRQELAPKKRPELSLPVLANSQKYLIFNLNKLVIFFMHIFISITRLNRNDLPNQDANHLLVPSSAGHLNALLTPGADGTTVI